ncbi:MAG: leucyl/phenylalanyl-tRNA--protein transferase [Gammaproteobacteria bacterium]|nr:leucyl/phenylalanyl-tRNA--protein transferase [Gammaproteobacteria bacterium]
MSPFERLSAAWETGEIRQIFPENLEPNEDGLIAIGGNLSVDLVIEAYIKGHFPWTGEHPIPWFSPDPRLILLPQQFKASHTLRRLARQGKFTVCFDSGFQAVLENCAAIPRKGETGTWITPNMVEVYTELHKLHIAHSVEVYQDQELCGGLYGLTFGRAFFGESMFARISNTSKLALYALCQFLVSKNFDFIDCQQETPHLQSLGGVSVSRKEYLNRLQHALQFSSLHKSWREEFE